MSRSIHTTRRDLARLKKYDFADEQERSLRLRRLRESLNIKRSMKNSVRTERRGQVGAPLATLPEAVPIRVLDQGTYVHYPASPTDLLCVMRMLPPGMIDGLGGIELCLGTEYQRGAAEGRAPDPYTGRYGSETLPGVYCGPVLGVYFPQTALIRLFAYVYGPDWPYRDVWEVHLRLQMLSSLVHEIAHHYDEMERVARGRWRADQSDAVEMYAERMQYAWDQQVVIPYIQATYPQETEALCNWISHYGGIRLPFAELAGDPRSTARGGFIRGNALFGMSGALETLVSEVHNGKPLKASRLEFANQLHYQERYEDALTIIQRVLAENPEDPEALLLQADIYVHQERYADAVALAQQVIAGSASNCYALEVLSDAYGGLERWERVVETNTRLLAVSEPHTWQWADALCERGMALVAMGDVQGARADLAALGECRKRFVLGRIRRLTNALNESGQDPLQDS